MQKFDLNASICHGVEKKDTRRKLAFILAKDIFSYLPDGLKSGDAIKIDCKITVILRD